MNLQVTYNFDYNPFESKNIAIKPSLFIDLYKSSYQKIIDHRNKERSKKIIELYQTSLFALGLTSIKSKECWVKLHDDKFPDSEIIFFGSIAKKRISTYIIENVAPKDKNITKAIIDKLCKKYSMEDPVLLLLYIDWDNSETDYDLLNSMIKKLKVNPFATIWSICKLNENKFEITQIYPIVSVNKFNLNETITKMSQQSSLLNIETKYSMKPSKKDYKVSLRVD